jgi:hypothetical protein
VRILSGCFDGGVPAPRPKFDIVNGDEITGWAETTTVATVEPTFLQEIKVVNQPVGFRTFHSGTRLICIADYRRLAPPVVAVACAERDRRSEHACNCVLNEAEAAPGRGYGLIIRVIYSEQCWNGSGWDEGVPTMVTSITKSRTPRFHCPNRIGYL